MSAALSPLSPVPSHPHLHPRGHGHLEEGSGAQREGCSVPALAHCRGAPGPLPRTLSRCSRHSWTGQPGARGCGNSQVLLGIQAASGPSRRAGCWELGALLLGPACRLPSWAGLTHGPGAARGRLELAGWLGFSLALPLTGWVHLGNKPPNLSQFPHLKDTGDLASFTAWL